MPLCKTCRSEVMWFVTETGAKIPINVLPSIAGNIELVGDVARVVPLKDRGSRQLYVAHFVTCRDADLFRRPR